VKEITHVDPVPLGGGSGGDKVPPLQGETLFRRCHLSVSIVVNLHHTLNSRGHPVSAASVWSSAFRQCRSTRSHADDPRASFGTFTRLSTGHTSGFIVVRYALSFALPARTQRTTGRPAIRRVAMKTTLTCTWGVGDKTLMAFIAHPDVGRVI
jgi:hypothetical protein